MDPPDYDGLLEHMKALAAADQRVLGLLLYGSRVTGKADAFSDLDLGVITTDAGARELVRERAALLAQVGEVLFLEDFGDPTHTHAILTDGAAFEFIVRPIGELVDDGPHQIVLDKDGQVAAALARKVAREPEVFSAEGVRRQIQYFWHEVEHLVTALGRRDLLWAHGGLEEMRGICLRLARAAAGVDAEDEEPYWKVDTALDAELLERLRATIVPAETAPMRRAAGELLEIYRSLAHPLAERNGIAYPERLDALLSARLGSGR